MKRKLFILILLCISVASFAQDSTSTFIKTKFKGNIYEFFGKQISYPMPLAMNGIQGNVIVSFHLNADGVLDSIDFISFPHVQMAQDVAQVLQKTQNLWTPTVMNGQNVPYRYKLVVKYALYSDEPPSKSESFVLKEKAEKKFKKGKLEDALKLIDKAILIDPYITDFYYLRSQIYKSKNENEKSDEDYKTAQNLDKEIMAIITIVGWQRVQTVRY
ncbi:MAG TPA: energy transducer TonB [Bacteroidales bacterium]|nr:energy transducer TonB [Bacteroidales bacterium]HOK99583.1 energy transducer TonB [Bacteroidales bacterium]HPO66432.1 energy transducer TonB [Bacteroidales bacterium]